ncbi:MAG: 3-dehydroquinate synthase [Candidatus Brocadiales bacterium]
MKTVKVSLGSRSYKVHISAGILGELSRLLKKFPDVTKVIIITDKNVERFYGNIVTKDLRPYKPEVVVISIEPGEEQKSLSMAEDLYNRLFEHEVDRRGLVIALGGGVVGDLAGYVAATFMRGISYVQIPTTLMAQVDSSIGGKVAINHTKGKNLIGCFYQPKAVYIDPLTLKTLPREEMTQGLVEVIKYGMIHDASLFDYLDRHLPEILQLEPSILERVIENCCRIKAWVVERDEREETGLRSILNYGHTLGHAIEAMGGYKGHRHGEAVAIGMMLATSIAVRLGMADKKVLERQRQLLQRVGAPTYYRQDTEGLCDFLYRDKKAVAGRLNFVLPLKIGKVTLKEVDIGVVKEVLAGE